MRKFKSNIHRYSPDHQVVQQHKGAVREITACASRTSHFFKPSKVRFFLNFSWSFFHLKRMETCCGGYRSFIERIWRIKQDIVKQQAVNGLW